MVENLITNLPLTLEHVKMLSPVSERFIIPKNTTRIQPHAFIFYNTEDREGAENEANHMYQSFKVSYLVISYNIGSWSMDITKLQAYLNSSTPYGLLITAA